MNAISQSIKVAEQIADRHGDPHQYLNSYLVARESNGIMASIRIALQDQNLWDMFSDVCDPEVYILYFS
jgi:hypothetical protein